MRRIRKIYLLPLVTAFAFFAVACSSRDDTAADANASASADTSASATPLPDPNMQMAMTGDPDHDFLRMMSDHHTGMIQMVHAAVEREDAPGIKADAQKVDQAQDAELESMMSMLEKDYKDAYAPMVAADSKQMMDDLATRKGKEYERAFYEHAVMHHEQGIKMIDDYLPKLTKPAIKQMAEKMKADQTKEVSEFKKKAAVLPK